MIAIKSNKELTFDTVSRMKGIITVRIESYTRNAETKSFSLNIVDTLEYTETIRQFIQDPSVRDPITGIITVPEPREEMVDYPRVQRIRRSRSYSDAELLALASALDVTNVTVPTLILNLDDLFRQGLLLTTQMECQADKGIYLSEAQDWFIVE